MKTIFRLEQFHSLDIKLKTTFRLLVVQSQEYSPLSRYGDDIKVSTVPLSRYEKDIYVSIGPLSRICKFSVRKIMKKMHKEWGEGLSHI